MISKSFSVEYKGNYAYLDLTVLDKLSELQLKDLIKLINECNSNGYKVIIKCDSLNIISTDAYASIDNLSNLGFEVNDEVIWYDDIQNETANSQETTHDDKSANNDEPTNNHEPTNDDKSEPANVNETSLEDKPATSTGGIGDIDVDPGYLSRAKSQLTSLNPAEAGNSLNSAIGSLNSCVYELPSAGSLGSVKASISGIFSGTYAASSILNRLNQLEERLRRTCEDYDLYLYSSLLSNIDKFGDLDEEEISKMIGDIQNKLSVYTLKTTDKDDRKNKEQLIKAMLQSCNNYFENKKITGIQEILNKDSSLRTSSEQAMLSSWLSEMNELQPQNMSEYQLIVYMNLVGNLLTENGYLDLKKQIDNMDDDSEDYKDKKEELDKKKKEYDKLNEYYHNADDAYVEYLNKKREQFYDEYDPSDPAKRHQMVNQDYWNDFEKEYLKNREFSQVIDLYNKKTNGDTLTKDEEKKINAWYNSISRKMKKEPDALSENDILLFNSIADMDGDKDAIKPYLEYLSTKKTGLSEFESNFIEMNELSIVQDAIYSNIEESKGDSVTIERTEENQKIIDDWYRDISKKDVNDLSEQQLILLRVVAAEKRVTSGYYAAVEEYNNLGNRQDAYNDLVHQGIITNAINGIFDSAIAYTLDDANKKYDQAKETVKKQVDAAKEVYDTYNSYFDKVSDALDTMLRSKTSLTDFENDFLLGRDIEKNNNDINEYEKLISTNEETATQLLDEQDTIRKSLNAAMQNVQKYGARGRLSAKVEELQEELSVIDNKIKEVTAQTELYRSKVMSLKNANVSVLYPKMSDFKEYTNSRIDHYEVLAVSNSQNIICYDSSGNVLNDVSSTELAAYFYKNDIDIEKEVMTTIAANNTSMMGGPAPTDFSLFLSPNVKRVFEDYEAFKSVTLTPEQNASLVTIDYLRNKGNLELADYYLAQQLDSSLRIQGYEMAQARTELLDKMQCNIGDFFITIGFGTYDGLVQFSDGLYNIFGGADGRVTAKQYMQMEIAEYIKATYTVPEIMQGAYEVSNSIGNMLPSMAVSFVCPTFGSILMGASAAGNSIDENLQSGKDLPTAIQLGLISGASEALLERFLGGIPGLSNLDKFADIPGMRGYVAKMLSEATEEMSQEILDPVFTLLVTNEWEGIEWNDVAKAGIYAMITAGVMNTPSLFSDIKTINYLKEKYKGLDMTNMEIYESAINDFTVLRNSDEQISNLRSELKNSEVMKKAYDSLASDVKKNMDYDSFVNQYASNAVLEVARRTNKETENKEAIDLINNKIKELSNHKETIESDIIKLKETTPSDSIELLNKENKLSKLKQDLESINEQIESTSRKLDTYSLDTSNLSGADIAVELLAYDMAPLFGTDSAIEPGLTLETLEEQRNKLLQTKNKLIDQNSTLEKEIEGLEKNIQELKNAKDAKKTTHKRRLELSEKIKLREDLLQSKKEIIELNNQKIGNVNTNLDAINVQRGILRRSNMVDQNVKVQKNIFSKFYDILNTTLKNTKGSIFGKFESFLVQFNSKDTLSVDAIDAISRQIYDLRNQLSSSSESEQVLINNKIELLQRQIDLNSGKKGLTDRLGSNIFGKIKSLLNQGENNISKTTASLTTTVIMMKKFKSILSGSISSRIDTDTHNEINLDSDSNNTIKGLKKTISKLTDNIKKLKGDIKNVSLEDTKIFESINERIKNYELLLDTAKTKLEGMNLKEKYGFNILKGFLDGYKGVKGNVINWFHTKVSNLSTTSRSLMQTGGTVVSGVASIFSPTTFTVTKSDTIITSKLQSMIDSVNAGTLDTIRVSSINDISTNVIEAIHNPNGVKFLAEDSNKIYFYNENGLQTSGIAFSRIHEFIEMAISSVNNRRGNFSSRIFSAVSRAKNSWNSFMQTKSTVVNSAKSKLANWFHTSVDATKGYFTNLVKNGISIDGNTISENMPSSTPLVKKYNNQSEVLSDLQDVISDTKIETIFTKIMNARTSEISSIYELFVTMARGKEHARLLTDDVVQSYNQYMSRIEDSGKFIVWNQGNYFSHIYTTQSNLDCKLYLNASFGDSLVFTQQFVQKCTDRGLRFYIKFVQPNTSHMINVCRDESVCVYCSNDNVSTYINICNEIIAENPNLEFMDPPLLSQKIGDSKIGYGADVYTSLKGYSSNEIRGNLFGHAFSKLAEKYSLYSLDINQIKSNLEFYSQVLGDFKSLIYESAKELSIKDNFTGYDMDFGDYDSVSMFDQTFVDFGKHAKNALRALKKTPIDDSVDIPSYEVRGDNKSISANQLSVSQANASSISQDLQSIKALLLKGISVMDAKYGQNVGIASIRQYIETGVAEKLTRTGNFRQFVTSLDSNTLLKCYNMIVGDVQNASNVNIGVKQKANISNPIAYMTSVSKSQLKGHLKNMIQAFINEEWVEGKSDCLYASLVDFNSQRKQIPLKSNYDRFVNRFSKNKYCIPDGDDYFRHVWSNGFDNSSIEHRLYINGDLNDTYQFLELFANVCESKGLPFYFKTAYMYFDSDTVAPPGALTRSESAVIYAGTKFIAEYTQICQEIKNAHPEFKFYSPSVATSSIDGWLGYGMEASDDIRAKLHAEGVAASFNGLRAHIFDRALAKGISDFITQYGNTSINKKTVNDLCIDSIYSYIVNKYKVSNASAKNNLYQYLMQNKDYYINRLKQDKQYFNVGGYKYLNPREAILILYKNYLNSNSQLYSSVENAISEISKEYKVDPNNFAINISENTFVGNDSVDIPKVVSPNESTNTAKKSRISFKNGVALFDIDGVQTDNIDSIVAVANNPYKLQMAVRAGSVDGIQLSTIIEILTEANSMGFNIPVNEYMQKVIDLYNISSKTFDVATQDKLLQEISDLSLVKINSYLHGKNIADLTIQEVIAEISDFSKENIGSYLVDYYENFAKLDEFISGLDSKQLLDLSRTLSSIQGELFHNTLSRVKLSIANLIKKQLLASTYTDIKKFAIDYIAEIDAYLCDARIAVDIARTIKTDAYLQLSELSKNNVLDDFIGGGLKNLLRDVFPANQLNSYRGVLSSAYRVLGRNYLTVYQNAAKIKADYLIDGIKIHVIGNNATFLEGYYHNFVNALQGLPVDLKTLITSKDVYLYDISNPEDIAGAISHGLDPQTCRTTGDTDSSTIIRFWNYDNDIVPSVDYLYEVACHEIGHFLDYSYGQIFGFDSHWTEHGNDWENAQRRDFEYRKQFGLKDVGHMSVTDYGNTKIQEDFAESIKLFLKDQLQFFKNYPNRYKVLMNIFSKIAEVNHYQSALVDYPIVELMTDSQLNDYILSGKDLSVIYAQIYNYLEFYEKLNLNDPAIVKSIFEHESLHETDAVHFVYRLSTEQINTLFRNLTVSQCDSFFDSLNSYNGVKTKLLQRLDEDTKNIIASKRKELFVHDTNLALQKVNSFFSDKSIADMSYDEVISNLADLKDSNIGNILYEYYKSVGELEGFVSILDASQLLTLSKVINQNELSSFNELVVKTRGSEFLRNVDKFIKLHPKRLFESNINYAKRLMSLLDNYLFDNIIINKQYIPVEIRNYMNSSTLMKLVKLGNDLELKNFIISTVNEKFNIHYDNESYENLLRFIANEYNDTMMDVYTASAKINKTIKMDDVNVHLIGNDNSLLNIYYKNLCRVYEKLPNVLRNMLKENDVYIFDIVCPGNSLSALDYYGDISHPFVRAADFSRENSHIRFWYNKEIPTVREVMLTLSHELGHSLDVKYGGGDYYTERFDNWKDVQQLDETISKKKAVTRYGETNVSEDFAESVMLYVNNKDSFSQKFPNRAKILDTLFRSLEDEFKTYGDIKINNSDQSVLSKAVDNSGFALSTKFASVLDKIKDIKLSATSRDISATKASWLSKFTSIFKNKWHDVVTLFNHTEDIKAPVVRDTAYEAFVDEKGLPEYFKDIRVVNESNSSQIKKVWDHLDYVGMLIGANKLEIKSVLDQKMQEFITDGTFGLRINTSNLEEVLECGYFKNLFETGTSDGYANEDKRLTAEEVTLGVPKDMINASDRPVYGMIAPNIESSEFIKYLQVGPGSTYGGKNGNRAYVVFDKSKIMDYTTFTIGDSLDYRFQVVGSLASYPEYRGSFQGDSNFLEYRNRRFYTVDELKTLSFLDMFPVESPDADTYLELQFHGKKSHSIDMISEVVFVDKEPSIEMKKLLLEKGINYKTPRSFASKQTHDAVVDSKSSVMPKEAPSGIRRSNISTNISTLAHAVTDSLSERISYFSGKSIDSMSVAEVVSNISDFSVDGIGNSLYSYYNRVNKLTEFALALDDHQVETLIRSLSAEKMKAIHDLRASTDSDIENAGVVSSKVTTVNNQQLNATRSELLTRFVSVLDKIKDIKLSEENHDILATRASLVSVLSSILESKQQEDITLVDDNAIDTQEIELPIKSDPDYEAIIKEKVLPEYFKSLLPMNKDDIDRTLGHLNFVEMLSGTDKATIKQVLDGKIEEFINDGTFGLRIDADNLKEVLECGYFRNLFETGKSDGSNDVDDRFKGELAVFGAPVDGIDVSDRPIYGMVVPNIDDENFIKYLQVGPGSIYGGKNGKMAYVVFDKNKIMDYTTFTIGDSLDYSDILVGSLARYPEYRGSFRGVFAEDYTDYDFLKPDGRRYYTVDELQKLSFVEMFPISTPDADTYLELQFHGNKSHSIDMISEIVFVDKEPSIEMKKLLLEKGINYRVAGDFTSKQTHDAVVDSESSIMSKEAPSGIRRSNISTNINTLVHAITDSLSERISYFSGKSIDSMSVSEVVSNISDLSIDGIGNSLYAYYKRVNQLTEFALALDERQVETLSKVLSVDKMKVISDLRVKTSSDSVNDHVVSSKATTIAKQKLYEDTNSLVLAKFRAVRNTINRILARDNKYFRLNDIDKMSISEVLANISDFSKDGIGVKLLNYYFANGRLADFVDALDFSQLPKYTVAFNEVSKDIKKFLDECLLDKFGNQYLVDNKTIVQKMYLSDDALDFDQVKNIVQNMKTYLEQSYLPNEVKKNFVALSFIEMARHSYDEQTNQFIVSECSRILPNYFDNNSSFDRWLRKYASLYSDTTLQLYERSASVNETIVRNFKTVDKNIEVTFKVIGNDQMILDVYKDQIIRAYDNLPNDLKFLFDGKVIRVYDISRPGNYASALKYYHDIHRTFTAAATANNSKSTISFWYNGELNSKDINSTLTHEVGHFVDYYLGNFTKKFDEWLHIQAEDEKLTKWKSVTEYGKTAVGEDFAESVMLYVDDPYVFSRNFPNRYKRLSALFKMMASQNKYTSSFVLEPLTEDIILKTISDGSDIRWLLMDRTMSDIVALIDDSNVEFLSQLYKYAVSDDSIDEFVFSLNDKQFVNLFSELLSNSAPDYVFDFVSYISSRDIKRLRKYYVLCESNQELFKGYINHLSEVQLGRLLDSFSADEISVLLTDTDSSYSMAIRELIFNKMSLKTLKKWVFELIDSGMSENVSEIVKILAVSNASKIKEFVKMCSTEEISTLKESGIIIVSRMAKYRELFPDDNDIIDAYLTDTEDIENDYVISKDTATNMELNEQFRQELIELDEKNAREFAELMQRPGNNQLMQLVLKNSKQKLKLERIVTLYAHQQGYTLEEFVKHLHANEKKNASDSVKQAALRVYNRASLEEDTISNFIKGLEDDVTSVAGFDFRRKSLLGIEAKILRKLDKDPTGLKTPSEFASEITDILRYTLLIDSEHYHDVVFNKVNELRENGYQLSSYKNAWGEAKYKGLNLTFISPSGLEFELQFHTPESYKAKESLTHLYYEIARSNLGEISVISNEIQKLYQLLYVVSPEFDYPKKSDFIKKANEILNNR